MVILEEIEQLRARFLKYTRKAFLKLPFMLGTMGIIKGEK